MLVVICLSVLLGAGIVCYLLRKILAKKIVADVAAVVDVPVVVDAPVVPAAPVVEDESKDVK